MKNKLHIIIDNKIPFIQGAFGEYAKVKYMPGSSIANKDVKNADALIIRTRTKCDKKLLENSRVKIIASATIGHDHIDKDYCKQSNIVWTNAPGCNSGSVMQYIASALISLSLKHDFILKGKTLGIVGCGNVGNKVLRLAKCLGMKTLINDPPLQRKGSDLDLVSLDKLLKNSDIITLHVPLNRGGIDNTFHLAGDTFFNKIKRDSILINSSRGEVVDEKELKTAIRDGKLKGAILDVWENEPNIDKQLLEMLDFATPHIAGYSADGKANGTSASVKAINQYFDLPFSDWFPEKIPSPKNPLLEAINDSKSVEEILGQLILSSYNIRKDDQRLRKSIDEFEHLRGNYPIRREFMAYKVKGHLTDARINDAIKSLGFRIA